MNAIHYSLLTFVLLWLTNLYSMEQKQQYKFGYPHPEKYLDQERSLNNQPKTDEDGDIISFKEKAPAYNTKPEYAQLHQHYLDRIEQCTKLLEVKESSNSWEKKLIELVKIIQAQPFDKEKYVFAHPICQEVSEQIIKLCFSRHAADLRNNLHPSAQELLKKYGKLAIDFLKEEKKITEKRITTP